MPCYFLSEVSFFDQMEQMKEMELDENISLWFSTNYILWNLEPHHRYLIELNITNEKEYTEKSPLSYYWMLTDNDHVEIVDEIQITPDILFGLMDEENAVSHPCIGTWLLFYKHYDLFLKFVRQLHTSYTKDPYYFPILHKSLDPKDIAVQLNMQLIGSNLLVISR